MRIFRLGGMIWAQLDNLWIDHIRLCRNRQNDMGLPWLTYGFYGRNMPKIRISRRPNLPPLAEEAEGYISRENQVGSLNDAVHLLSMTAFGYFQLGELNKALPLIERALDVNQSIEGVKGCLLYTSPSPRDQRGSRMPSSA